MKRRKFIKAGGVLLVAVGAGLGPVLFRNRRLYGKTKPLMGTLAEIQVVHSDATPAYRAIDAVFEELFRLERQLSFYRPDSEVGLINRHSFSKEVHVSDETGLLIKRALAISKITKGNFDPGLGKVTQVWDVKHRKTPPHHSLWQRYADQSFYSKIVLQKSSDGFDVRFLSEDIHIDLGGIGKGYAADRAVAVLQEQGISQGLVNLGGDIATLGGRSEDQGWRVGIKDPVRPGEICRVLTLIHQSVATSGSYETYFTANREIYHHLIDPKIAQPGRRKFSSMTVIGDNCGDADALATGLFLMDDRDVRMTLEDYTNQFDFFRLDG